jgi:UDP-glucose 4-epimerase
VSEISVNKIMVTGGAGYIGSHTCVELLNSGYDVVVYDNFSNSHPEALKRVEQITGKKVEFVKGDIRDQVLLEKTLKNQQCEAVIHFAGLKAVGESIEKPLEYYGNNIIGTHSLLVAMKNVGLNAIVFSSSATVYGEPQYLPLDEKHPLSATNPYGRSKLFIEDMLRDCFKAEPAWKIIILRYFNPVGAHESGLIGEDPQNIPNNLMPFVAQVAVGRREKLNIWGGDYPSPDGTGIRDYIHVTDLAKGHLKALKALKALKQPQCKEINLGTGQGYSVLEVVAAFETASGKTVPYVISSRRAGDVASCYADTALAEQYLQWKAESSLQQMCHDHWHWQKKNPKGYM